MQVAAMSKRRGNGSSLAENASARGRTLSFRAQSDQNLDIGQYVQSFSLIFLPTACADTTKPPVPVEKYVTSPQINRNKIIDRSSCVASASTWLQHIYVTSFPVITIFLRFALATIAHCCVAFVLLSCAVDYEFSVYLRGCQNGATALRFSTLPSHFHHGEAYGDIIFSLGPLSLRQLEDFEHGRRFWPALTFDICSRASLVGQLIGLANESTVDDRGLQIESDSHDDVFSSVAHGVSAIAMLTSPSYSPPPPSLRLDVAVWLKLSSLPTAQTPLSPQAGLSKCWAFRGVSGQLGIDLPRPVHVSGIAFEHPLDLHPKSALRAFILWGLEDQQEPHTLLSQIEHLEPHSQVPEFGPYRGIPIISGSFAVTGAQRQKFTLQNQSYSQKQFKKVVLQVLDNWGQSEYTCLYHVDVLGREIV
ncbi:hypothetical protein DENSPDRAFT_215545 [Dentipellis sp. KUC8613]|nr:hypothetical protein DENSPDRAFT_215545 [Dentipellis sp. KUC8613]